MIRLIYLLFPCVMLACLPVWGVESRQWISPQQLHLLLREGGAGWVIDIRDGASYAQGHIEGSLHIPLQHLESKRFAPNKTVVLVDDTLGVQDAQRAAEILRKKGIERTFVLKGGVPAWQQEGFSLAGTGSGRIVRRVTPEQLALAREQEVPFQLFDLRDAEEQERAPVAKAHVLKGGTIDERFRNLQTILTEPSKKRLKDKLEAAAPIVVVLPLTANVDFLIDRYLRNMSGDIRYLEGGLAAWAVRADKRIDPPICPTCPQTTSTGVKK